jgi:hypothetical protein
LAQFLAVPLQYAAANDFAEAPLYVIGQGTTLGQVWATWD